MIYVKTNTLGVDSAVYEIQKLLDSELTWLGTFDIYGVCEQTERTGNKLIEFYKSANEYCQPFFNDNKSGIIGFDVKDYFIKGHLMANIRLLATVNLKTIHAEDYRSDQRAFIEVMNIIRDNRACNEITGVDVGMDVFKQYTNIKANGDMQPWYVFAISMVVKCTDQFYTPAFPLTKINNLTKCNT